eukprot:g26122.t1
MAYENWGIRPYASSRQFYRVSQPLEKGTPKVLNALTSSVNFCLFPGISSTPAFSEPDSHLHNEPTEDEGLEGSDSENWVPLVTCPDALSLSFSLYGVVVVEESYGTQNERFLGLGEAEFWLWVVEDQCCAQLQCLATLAVQVFRVPHDMVHSSEDQKIGARFGFLEELGCRPHLPMPVQNSKYFPNKKGSKLPQEA